MNDFRELIIHNLQNLKARYNPNDDTYRLLLNFLQLRDKLFIPQHKFKVIYSKEFSDKLAFADTNCQNAVADIKTRLENGNDIIAYLSRSVRSANSQAMLVRNWNIHHAHINEPVEGESKKSKNSSALLFFTYDNDIVYFLDILPHPKGDTWFCTSLLEIIYDNDWKHLLNIMPRITNVEPKLSDKQINNHMKNSVIFVPVRDCVVCPINLGVASSGDCSISVKTAKHFFNSIQGWSVWQKEHMQQHERYGEIFKEGQNVFNEFSNIQLFNFDSDYFYVYDVYTEKTVKLKVECRTESLKTSRYNANQKVIYFKPCYYYVHDKQANEIEKVIIQID